MLALVFDVNGIVKKMIVSGTGHNHFHFKIPSNLLIMTTFFINYNKISSFNYDKILIIPMIL